MAEITTELIKALRDETGISVMQVKKALEEAQGDVEKAKVILRKTSASIAAKKNDRELGAGIAAAYVHAGGTVVAAVVLGCETDFVSKNEEFGKLAYDIAMHVAAMKPVFKSKDDVTEDKLRAAREVFADEAKNVPEAKRDIAIQGKLDAYIAERALMEQPFVKNGDVTIRELLAQAVQKFGERVEVVRFERLSVK